MLTRVEIEATEGSAGTCKAMFNPKELTINKSVSWEAKDAHQEDPKAEFTKPQPTKLSCTLYFDTYETKADVYGHVAPLENMARMDPALKRPPLCLFKWGKFVFKGVVTEMNQKYTMFLDDGTRVRCEVSLGMQAASLAVVSVKGA
jgi:hypothetical protein